MMTLLNGVSAIFDTDEGSVDYKRGPLFTTFLYLETVSILELLIYIRIILLSALDW